MSLVHSPMWLQYLGAEPGCGQEPQTLSRMPVWEAGAQVVGPASAAFPCVLAGSLIGNRTARTRTSALMGVCQCYWQHLNSLCHNASPHAFF